MSARRGIGYDGWEKGECTVIDTKTNKPIRVVTTKTAGAYLMFPMSQLDTVKQVLDSGGINYWADRFSISLNGQPEVVFVNIGKKEDPNVVQQLLDNTP